MSNLIPASGGRGKAPGLYVTSAVARRTARALERVEGNTLVRLATVQSDGIVQAEKVHEIDHLTRVAMTGQAMLGKWKDTLAAGDPFIADELKFFSDMARMGKGEIIADTIDTFCREGRT